MIGIDITSVNRIKNMYEKFGEKAYARFLSEKEIALVNRIETAAGFWAAKEAASKALGTGIAAGVSFQHIDIEADEFGKPILNFTEQALVVANTLQATHFHVSISDEANYAVAFVVLSR